MFIKRNSQSVSKKTLIRRGCFYAISTLLILTLAVCVINRTKPQDTNMTVKQLKKTLDEHGLGNRFKSLKPLIRSSIRLHQNEFDENKIAIGQTKIGGRPDLPRQIVWPTETRVDEDTQEESMKSMSFIAQINLSEVARYDTEKLLPKSGCLYFFYTAEQDAWGDDYEDGNKFKVIYWEGNSNELKRTEFPNDLDEEARFKAGSVKIASEMNLPSIENKFFENWTEEEKDNFSYDILEEFYDGEPKNKLFGYADVVQDEMELECELVTNGLNCDDLSGYDDPRVKAHEPNAKNWRLLLQIDSNEKNGMMWGDCGMIYFWIKRKIC